MHSSSSLVLISVILTMLFDRTLSNYEGVIKRKSFPRMYLKERTVRTFPGRYQFRDCTFSNIGKVLQKSRAFSSKTLSSTCPTSQEPSNLSKNMNDFARKRDKNINKITKGILVKEQISEINKVSRNIIRRQRSSHETVSSLTKYSIYKISDLRKTIYLMEPYQGSSSDVYIVLSLDSESADTLGKHFQQPITNFILCKNGVYSIENKLHDVGGGIIHFENVYRALVDNSQEKTSRFGKFKNFFSKIHKKQPKNSSKSRSKRQTLILTSVIMPSSTSPTVTKSDETFVKNNKKVNEVTSSLKSLIEKQSSSNFNTSKNATQNIKEDQELDKKDDKASSKQINVQIESTIDALKPESGDSTLVVDVFDIIHEKEKVKEHKDIPSLTNNRHTMKNNIYNANLRYARKYSKEKELKNRTPVVRYNLLYKNIIRNSKNVYFYHVIKSKQIFNIGLPFRQDGHTFLIVHLNRKIIHSLRKIAKPSIQMLLGNEILYFEINSKKANTDKNMKTTKPRHHLKPVTNIDNDKQIYHTKGNVIKTNISVTNVTIHPLNIKRSHFNIHVNVDKSKLNILNLIRGNDSGDTKINSYIFKTNKKSKELDKSVIKKMDAF